MITSVLLPKNVLNDYLDRGSPNLKAIVEEYLEVSNGGCCSMSAAVERQKKLQKLSEKIREIVKSEKFE